MSATSRRSRRQSQQRGSPDGTAAAAAAEEEDAAEGSGSSVTRSTLLQRVRAPSVGLHSKLVYAGGKDGAEHAYLLIGAPLARLAKEAERIKLPMQLKSGLEERLKRERELLATGAEDELESPRGAAAVSPRSAGAPSAAGAVDGIVSREGGGDAYAPYRRRVHKLYQLAAHPHFFSCAQRSLLLRSILEAPSTSGGCELKLARLEKLNVVTQIFALHDDKERQVLEERWTTESSLGLGAAPIRRYSTILARMSRSTSPSYGSIRYAYGLLRSSGWSSSCFKRRSTQGESRSSMWSSLLSLYYGRPSFCSSGIARTRS